MVLHTQGAGNAHAFTLAANRPMIRMVNPHEAYPGILDRRTWDDPSVIDDPLHVIFPDAYNYDERYRQLGRKVLGRSRIAIEVNGFSDCKYSLARDCGFKIPKMYTHDPGGSVRKIGQSVWIENKIGHPIWFRAFLQDGEIRMPAVYGTNSFLMAGNLGKEMPAPVLTYACSMFYSDFPEKKCFSALVENLKADGYQGPFAVCLVGVGGEFWFRDMHIGYAGDVEFALTLLTEDPASSLLGELPNYSKGFAITARAIGEDNENPISEDLFRKVHADDMIHVSKKKIVQLLGSPVVSGYGHRYKEAFKNLVAAAEIYLPGYGYRADAGKRANEWYYNFKQEVGRG